MNLSFKTILDIDRELESGLPFSRSLSIVKHLLIIAGVFNNRERLCI